METLPTPDQPRVGHVTLRYWAAARAAAGVAEELVEVSGPVPLRDLIAAVNARHGHDPRLERVLGTCSVLLGDRPVGKVDQATVLVSPGDSVDLLPPFAGG